MNLINLVKTGCLAVVCILFSSKSFAQPSANFTATPLAGCAPLLVNFSDNSTGNPTSWKWTLGNGTVSYLKDPSVAYFNPGQYTVKLVVTNASGSDSVIRTDYITVYEKPTVSFSANATTGCTPMTTTFTDLSTPGNGTIVFWQWDFGDGTFSNLQNPEHTYTSTGNFNVSLLVRNSFGCIETVTQANYINIASKPLADFTNGSTANCGTPLTVSFQNLSTGTGSLSYVWNFGDGTTSTQADPTHTYLTGGSITLTLIVTNQNGCADTLVKPDAFIIQSVHTAFTAPATICANTAFTIVNTTTPAAVGNLWSFGDGTTSTVAQPTKTYSAPGTYQIKLVNNFGVCTDSVTSSITVLQSSTSFFTASILSSCMAPLTVPFTNSSTNAATYLWNFGDGTTSTEANPSHTYTIQGNFTVSLTTTSSDGCTNVKTRNQYINIIYPIVSIDSLPRKGCAPLSVDFHPRVVGGDAIASYLWEFGDGTTSTLVTPNHIFLQGWYNIKLTVVTISGCTGTVTYLAGVKAGIRPVAAFSATPREACAEFPVVFADSTTPINAATSWNWDFGDGGTSTTQNPSHLYQDTGHMTIQLIVANNGCPDTLIVEDYVYIKPPIAKFLVASTCTNRKTRIFTDQSIGADTWEWNFGDGTNSTIPSPTHIYNASGTYIVSLKVTNIQSGCSFIKTQPITVIAEVVDFTASETVICKASAITFNTTVPSTLFSGIRWNFGDLTTGSTVPVTKIYYNSGTYTIKLITTDRNGCKDTIIKPRYIRVNGPTAKFGSSAVSGCIATTINFIDSSTNDGINQITKWIWNFGDGRIDTLTTTGSCSHTYLTAGNYTVTLTAIDATGCSSLKIKTNLVSIVMPTANFNSPDVISCPNKTISFTNLSLGVGLTYRWHFGDGTTSTVQNPVHTYPSNGLYSVKLVVTNPGGCMDSITKPNFINIQTPVARFTASDTIGTCPPLIVNFTNNSLNYVSKLWDFGDGTSTSTNDPSHFYSIAGTYIAKLTVTSYGGCTSQMTQRIVVKGPSGTFTYGALSGCNPLNVQFRATTRGTDSYVWDFNDGYTNVTTDSVKSHIYSIAGAYIPKVILRDATGCIVPLTGRDTIHVYDLTTNFNFNAQAMCDEGTIQFNNTTATNDVITSYTWNFGDGSTSATGQANHHYTTSGTYYPQLIASTLHGCSDTVKSISPVKIVASPQAIITQTANGCVNLNVTFNGRLAVPDTSAISWEWNFGNGNTSTSINPTRQDYTTAGVYPIKLLIANSTGCKDTVLSSVEAYEIPTIEGGSDTMLCKGRGITLTATGGSTYQWSPSRGLSCTNCASPIANPDSALLYHVIGTSIHGCTNKDSINVRVRYPFNMTTSRGDTLCVGQSLRLTASGAYSYSWTPATGLDDANIASPTATPDVTTIYQVVSTDDRHCFTDTAKIPVVVYNIPTVEAGLDKTINVGQSIDLTPEISRDVIDAKWSPTGSIFRSNFPNISIKPRETTKYRVEVTNKGGCKSYDELIVNVLCDGANMFIPNTFSPNGDGMNDLFYPRGSGIFTIKRIKIFSRWGEVIFEKNNFQANDQSKAWDGTFKGSKLNPDVFVYVVEVVCDNNSVLTFKGNVALIK